MERAGEILDSFFRRNNISGGRNYVAFYRSWEQIVGQDLASHTNLTEIRNNAVCVEVDHPAWMQMVQLRQADILKAIQTRFPALQVRSLQLRLVESLGVPAAVAPAAPAAAEAVDVIAQPPLERAGGAAAPSSSSSPPPSPPSADEQQALQRIQSDALRSSLQRLRDAIRDSQ
ncbi:MAG: DUF721 domain-containing protein [Spirochaetaceae bacterium]|nr:MAG: DUF721 domain-containing protein [Spirochaetaceae bacterium]